MELRMIGGKRGIFFVIDALIAASLITIGLLLVTSFYISENKPISINYMSSDMVRVLSELKVYEINSSEVEQLIAEDVLPERSINISVAELIGELWATNNTGVALNITMDVIDPAISPRFGYGVYVGNDEVYSRPNAVAVSSISSQKMISGIERDRSIIGYSAKVYLSSIKDRVTSSFVYFGGFEGEGNITKKFILPDDFNLTELYLELEAGTDFKLYINGDHCGDFPLGSGGGDYLVPDRWDLNLTECNESSFAAGENELEIRFEPIDENFTAEGPNYIAGGYFRATYISRNMTNLDVSYVGDDAITRYRFPGIEGYPNLYSSFFVPGNLSEMIINLTYDSDYSLVLLFGNVTIYEGSAPFNGSVELNNTNISATLVNTSMDYDGMSMKTIPLRLMPKDLMAGDSLMDIALATDISESMSWRLDEDSPGAVRNCDHAMLNDSSTARLSGAKCAAEAMVDELLSSAGPKIGLVAYEDSTETMLDLTNDSEVLAGEISGYIAGGGTCLCCGVRDATAVLMSDDMNTIIPRKSDGWVYNDKDLSSPPSDWTNLSFSGSGWKEKTSVFRNTYNGLGTPRTVLSKYEGDYYFRRIFEIDNASALNEALLYVLSDDGADVYLNDVLIDNDYASGHSAYYWNRDGIDINTSLFVDGENIIAVRLWNSETCFGHHCWATDVAFDLELVVSESNITNPRNKAMIVMTDGEANYECDGTYGEAGAKQDAIDKACDAYSKYGISVYTIGYGYSADEDTLMAMANCSNGEYYNASSVSELIDTYREITSYLVKFAGTQTANYSEATYAWFSPESFMEFNYSPIIPEPQYGMIPISVESPIFGNNISSTTLYIPSDADLLDLKTTSYSADMWTSFVNVSNTDGVNIVFNLSVYDNLFYELGDPYHVDIPVDIIKTGEQNTIDVMNGADALNFTEGSSYDKLIYTVLLDSVLDYSGVYTSNDGCNWSIDFEDGRNTTLLIPGSYNGSKICYFGNATYDTSDSMDDAAYRLFDRLDLDSNGLLEVRLDENNLLIDSMFLEDIPSMWGPEILEVRVWQ